MRLLQCSDLHLGLHRYAPAAQGPRDTARLFALIERTAVEREVDVVVFPGDVFHVRRPAPEHVLAFVRLVRSLTRAGVRVIITSGNHDGAGTIHDVEAKTAAWMEALDLPGVYAYAAPTVAIVPVRRGAIALATIPYPHRRSFDAILPDARPVERIAAVSAAAEMVIEELARRIEETVEWRGAPRLFVGHLSVLGARLGIESAMRLGWDVTVRNDVFDLFDYAALGHIHVLQQVSEKAWYSGSPDREDFGEGGDPKGFLLVDVERGVLPRVEVIDTGARPFLTFDLEDFSIGLPEFPPDSVVRLRLHESDGNRVTPLQRVEFERLARAQGCAWVKVEVVRAAGLRARVDLAPGAGVFEALGRYLDSRGLPHEPYLGVARELLDG